MLESGQGRMASEHEKGAESDPKDARGEQQAASSETKGSTGNKGTEHGDGADAVVTSHDKLKLASTIWDLLNLLLKGSQ